VKTNTLRSGRPPGRLAPHPAARASASLALAALAARARQGELMVLAAEATLRWRLALPRRGGWRRAQRSRLPTRPLSQRQSRRAESRKRPAWVRSRSWSRSTSGVVLRVLGAVPEGTSKVFSTIVPHGDAQELRPYLHPVGALCSPTGQEVVMVVDRRGLPRAHQLDTTLDHDHGTFPWPW
jgi:hypothetical protein